MKPKPFASLNHFTVPDAIDIFLNCSKWAFRPKARTSRGGIREIWAVPMNGATTDQQTQRLRILQRPYTRHRPSGQPLFAGEGLPEIRIARQLVHGTDQCVTEHFVIIVSLVAHAIAAGRSRRLDRP